MELRIIKLLDETTGKNLYNLEFGKRGLRYDTKGIIHQKKWKIRLNQNKVCFLNRKKKLLRD